MIRIVDEREILGSSKRLIWHLLRKLINRIPLPLVRIRNYPYKERRVVIEPYNVERYAGGLGADQVLGHGQGENPACELGVASGFEVLERGFLDFPDV